MPINKDLPLGAVHIKLPFNSMDDISFSGAYGGVADALVEKLREHLKDTGGEPNPEDNDSDEGDGNLPPPIPTEGDNPEELRMQLPHQNLGKLPNANNQ